jgi:hypothetical protein
MKNQENENGIMKTPKKKPKKRAKHYEKPLAVNLSFKQIIKTAAMGMSIPEKGK